MDPIEYIKKGKVQRYFRATKKLNAPNIVSHITQRAAGKEPLFIENDDYLSMLSFLKTISQDFSLEVYSFCLMSNHVHLLFNTRENNLYDAMRELFSRYAMRFNRKYERKGHLFAGPYRQSICLDDAYLLAASIYIHLNPVKAQYSITPEGYRWSSCRLFCTDTQKESFINPGFILGLFTGSKSEKITQYRNMLRKGLKFNTERIFEQKGVIENFQAELAEIYPSLFKKISTKKLIAKITGFDLFTADELEKKIISIKTSGKHTRAESRKAKKYLIEQLIARGYNRKEISSKLSISRKTIYNILNSKG